MKKAVSWEKYNKLKQENKRLKNELKLIKKDIYANELSSKELHELLMMDYEKD